LDVAWSVGCAKALELRLSNMDEHISHFKQLRSRLINGLDEKFGNQYQVNGSREHGVPHIVNVSFIEDGEGLDGEMLLLNLDVEGVCVSGGSTCSSGAVDPSLVLSGIGLVDT